MWIGVFLVGLGILFWLDNLPEYKGKIFFPGILILIGILILVGGIIRWASKE
jgi:hypothetical protein